jgi:cytosine/adenosine deaminase-related metal-dependent hydrolase
VSVRVVAGEWVLPGRGEGGAGPALPAIPDGAVALEGDRILAVGGRAELEARFGRAARLDAVLLPALVNAHLHLELSHLHGRVGGGEGLAPWIQLLVSSRAGARQEDVLPAMQMAAEDLVAFGVAAVGDVSNTLASLAPLGAAGLLGTVFHELFGFTPARIAASLAAAEAARAAAGRPPPGLRVAATPHAVYSTEPVTLSALLRAGPASIHLAEDPAERDLCARGAGPFARMLASFGARLDELRPRGRSAVAVVANDLAPRHLAVHCVDVDPEDVALLARSGATVVLCPRSNRHIGGGVPPLEALLAAGIPLAVGTDSLASAPSLSPLAELAVLRAAFPPVPAVRLLPLAWNGGAVGAPVGTLRPGLAPGLLAAPLGGTRPADPFEFVLASLGAQDGRPTWLARPRPQGTEEVRS